MNETTPNPDQVKATAIIAEGLKAGSAKNVILTSILKNTNLDLQAAAVAYSSVAKDTGYTLSNEEKEKLTNAIGTQFTVEGKLQRKGAEAALAEQGHMSLVAAGARLKAYCDAAKVEYPKATRVKRDMELVKTAVKQWHEQKVDKASIIAGLVQHYQYSETSALEAYRKIGIDLGFIEKRGSGSRQEMVNWFIANADKDKKTVCANMQLDKDKGGWGIGKATAEAYYGQYLFAVAYHEAMTAPKEAVA